LAAAGRVMADHGGPQTKDRGRILDIKYIG
jgi:hypothetical protein